jgi:hypothetical protein
MEQPARLLHESQAFALAHRGDVAAYEEWARDRPEDEREFFIAVCQNSTREPGPGPVT